MKKVLSTLKLIARKDDLQQITIGDIVVDVVRKDIKNVYLNVYPPSGRVRISAPRHMGLETIRAFVVAKLAWIRKHQARLRKRAMKASPQGMGSESHLYLGRRYPLKISEDSKSYGVALKSGSIEICFRSAASKEKANVMLDKWYRQRLRDILPVYIQKWEQIMQVQVEEFGIKKMRTRWGTCNSRAGRIWFNLELAKQPLHCIEYIVVHEMVHFLTRKHDATFKAYMDKFLADWRIYKKAMNTTPLRYHR